MSEQARPATWEEVEELKKGRGKGGWIDMGYGPFLLTLIEQLRDQINFLCHDQRQERGYALGRAEMKQEFLQWMQKEEDKLAARVQEWTEESEIGSLARIAQRTCNFLLEKARTFCSDPLPQPPPDVVRDALKTCLEVLAQLEWVVAVFDSVGWEKSICPSCNHPTIAGHQSDCSLAAALAVARAALPDQKTR